MSLIGHLRVDFSSFVTFLVLILLTFVTYYFNVFVLAASTAVSVTNGLVSVVRPSVCLSCLFL